MSQYLKQLQRCRTATCMAERRAQMDAQDEQTARILKEARYATQRARNLLTSLREI